MHSSNMGYVSRKVSQNGYSSNWIIVLSSIRWGFMVIFWNFAGVPFVWVSLITYLPLTNITFQTYVYSVVYMASHDPSKYRFSTPVYVLLFTTLLTAYYMLVYLFYFVASIMTVTFNIAGIRQCHRRADLRCRPRAFTLSAIRSRNCQGALSKTQLTYRLHTGALFASRAWSPTTLHIPYLSYHSNRLLTSGWWAYSRKPVSFSGSPNIHTKIELTITIRITLPTGP